MNWIICAWESPEEGETVLLTFRNSAGIHVDTAVFKEGAYYCIAETDTETYESPYGIPIAWMPMPKPYNPQAGVLKWT